MKLHNALDIVTLANGLIHALPVSCWGDDAQAALVFDTEEDAEIARRILAEHAVAKEREPK